MTNIRYGSNLELTILSVFYPHRAGRGHQVTQEKDLKAQKKEAHIFDVIIYLCQNVRRYTGMSAHYPLKQGSREEGPDSNSGPPLLQCALLYH